MPVSLINTYPTLNNSEIISACKKLVRLSSKMLQTILLIEKLNKMISDFKRLPFVSIKIKLSPIAETMNWHTTSSFIESYFVNSIPKIKLVTRIKIWIIKIFVTRGLSYYYLQRYLNELDYLRA